MKKSPPAAPPVYKPQPRVGILQQKRPAAAPTPFKVTTDAPKAPPVYRPNQPPTALQKKAAPNAQPSAARPNAVRPNAVQPPPRTAAPTAYRPEPKALVQRKAEAVRELQPEG